LGNLEGNEDDVLPLQGFGEDKPGGVGSAHFDIAFILDEIHHARAAFDGGLQSGTDEILILITDEAALLVFVGSFDEEIPGSEVAKMAVDGLDFSFFGGGDSAAGIDDEEVVIEELVGEEVSVVVFDFAGPVAIADGFEEIDLEFPLRESFIFFDDGTKMGVMRGGSPEGGDELDGFLARLHGLGVEEVLRCFGKGEGSACGEIAAIVVRDREIVDEDQRDERQDDLQNGPQADCQSLDGAGWWAHVDVGIRI